MTTTRATDPGIGMAFMSAACDERHWDAWERTKVRIAASDALMDWLGSHLDFPNEHLYLEVTDGDQTTYRMRRKNREIACKVPFARLDAAEDLDAEFDLIVHELYAAWAERRSISPPPH